MTLKNIETIGEYVTWLTYDSYHVRIDLEFRLIRVYNDSNLSVKELRF